MQGRAAAQLGGNVVPGVILGLQNYICVKRAEQFIKYRVIGIQQSIILRIIVKCITSKPYNNIGVQFDATKERMTCTAFMSPILLRIVV